MKVDLTPAQAAALIAAADSYLMAGTAEECRVIFGSDQGTAAAARAKEKLIPVAMPKYKRDLAAR